MSTHFDPCVLVLFGATGDLTRRKLTPALYALHCDGHLPAGFQVVAYGRRDKDDASFRADLLAHMQQISVEQALATSGLAPDLLELEVTEGTAMLDLARMHGEDLDNVDYRLLDALERQSMEVLALTLTYAAYTDAEFQRLLDDMALRRFGPETQRNYQRDVGRFATWLGRFLTRRT